MRRKRFSIVSIRDSVDLLASLSRQVIGAQYDPPVNYYISATGTGATLKTQLRTIISSMQGVNYGDARYSAPIPMPIRIIQAISY